MAPGDDWPVLREMAFLRVLQTARPIGLHKHLHMIQVLDGMEATGRTMTADEAWERLGEYYDLAKLDRLNNDIPGWEGDEDDSAQGDSEDGPGRGDGKSDADESAASSASDLPRTMSSFKAEFNLPYLDFGPEMATRRTAMAATADDETDSPTSSPLSKTATAGTGRRTRKVTQQVVEDDANSEEGEEHEEDGGQGPAPRRRRARTSSHATKPSPAPPVAPATTLTQPRRQSRRLTSPLNESTLPSVASSPGQTDVPVRETRTRRKK